MQLADFYFDLPKHLIADRPLQERSSSRLLCLDKKNGALAHHSFSQLIDLLTSRDLLVLNTTRVIPARLFGHKISGGKIELLVERILDDHHILAHLRASKKPKPHSVIHMTENIQLEVLGREDDLFKLKYLGEGPILEVIESIGQIPIPHYMGRAPDAFDVLRYQTIYAEHKGSVAAPTAGLHFDQSIFSRLQEKGVQIGRLFLHVGAGTFSPVRVDDIRLHRMHREYFSVSSDLCEQIRATKAAGGRVIAVGTTTARSLETASRHGSLKAMTGFTDIFIYPGFQFHCVDALITNFHLPGSTLLMLVAAFGGHRSVMQAYEAAVAAHYRFYSYGDAMWIA